MTQPNRLRVFWPPLQDLAEQDPPLPHRELPPQLQEWIPQQAWEEDPTQWSSGWVTIPQIPNQNKTK